MSLTGDPLLRSRAATHALSLHHCISLANCKTVSLPTRGMDEMRPPLPLSRERTRCRDPCAAITTYTASLLICT